VRANVRASRVVGAGILGGPMSRHNVEIVQSMFAAYGAGDFEAMLDTADADIELRPGIVGGPEGTVYRGSEGFRAFLATQHGITSTSKPKSSGTWATRSWYSDAREQSPATE
jgi:ketosteroid isomerase-like protein